MLAGAPLVKFTIQLIDQSSTILANAPLAPLNRNLFGPNGSVNVPLERRS